MPPVQDVEKQSFEILNIVQSPFIRDVLLVFGVALLPNAASARLAEKKCEFDSATRWAL